MNPTIKIMDKKSIVFQLIFLQFLSGLPSFNSMSSQTHCLQIERKALLDFKQSLTDPSGRFSSWVGEECCQWSGLTCNNLTGYVIKLDLQNPFQIDEAGHQESALRGKISSSLIYLEHLEYLDLSLNDFDGSQIPDFIGSFRSLNYLNLSHASFSGIIPPHLGNISSLHFLDLHAFSDSDHLLNAKDLHWLTGLSSLEYLDLGGIDLSSVVNWLEVVNMLPSLLELRLQDCNLLNFPHSLPFVNFTSLSVIDLSRNYFNSPMPAWLFNLTSLEEILFSSSNLIGPLPNTFTNLISLQHLDLSNQFLEGLLPSSLGNLWKLKSLRLSANNLTGNVIEFVDSLSGNNSLEVLDLTQNKFHGELPVSLGNLTSLRSFVLRQNMFWGSLPESIGRLSSLEELSMFGNPTNGSIPESIGQLSKLTVMNFGQTLWKGTISERHFLNLSRLENLEISSTFLKKSLNFNVDSKWNPPFKLKSIILAHIQAGPLFPEWVQTQNDLTRLFLNDIGISSTLPDGFWSWCSQNIDDLDLAHNQIRGTLPRSLHFQYAANVYLISNQFKGPLPMWTNLRRLYLWGNSFSGQIPENISEIMPKLRDLDLSENCLTGGIPPSIVNMRYLNTLVLSFNQLSGQLPKNWNQLRRLQVLDVSNNNLSGTIPGSIGFLHSVQLLSFSSNKFSGKIPLSMKNCTELWNLDLSDNRLSGSIPAWIGNITSLLILHLRSNFFSSKIPTQLCHLLNLHVLDLADNNLSGRIPQCLGNLSGMISHVPSELVHQYQGRVTIVAKGRELEYSSTLSLVKIIDLSANNLTGKVPEEITSLLRLGTLNLSMNHLTGRIPPMIGSLRWLETLDLSKNQLSGTIPSSISMISSLNHFNLSYNNLAGRIPLGNQLQTLNDPSIYEGNPGLCGDPLKRKCPDDNISSETSEEDNDENEIFDTLWFYVGLASGFIVGFWAVCGSLLLNKSWRLKYFKFIEEKKEKACVSIAVTLAHWKGRMKSIRNRDTQATFSIT